MHEEKVTCDGCGSDITTRSNSVDYRLTLRSESKPGYGAGVYTDMMIYPPVDRPYHFCGLGCLDHWRDRENYRDSLSREWWDAWVAKHGTKHDFGCSYPEPSNDILRAAKDDFAAAALQKFPMARLVRQ